MEIQGDATDFRFRTKNRALVRRTLRSAPLARELDRLVALDGSRVFRFERDGELANLSARLLNEYIGEHLGNGFTAKDFRTWGGTLVAANELARRGPAEDEADARRVLGLAMRKVGRELGNTPAVARASYVSPAVVDAYLAGRTIGDFGTKGRCPARLSAMSGRCSVSCAPRATRRRPPSGAEGFHRPGAGSLSTSPRRLSWIPGYGSSSRSAAAVVVTLLAMWAVRRRRRGSSPRPVRR